MHNKIIKINVDYAHKNLRTVVTVLPIIYWQLGLVVNWISSSSCKHDLFEVENFGYVSIPIYQYNYILIIPLTTKL